MASTHQDSDVTMSPKAFGTYTVDRDSTQQDVSLYYEVHRLESNTSATVEEKQEGGDARVEQAKDQDSLRVVFIMGLASTGVAWVPLLLQLRRVWGRQAGPALEALLFDNRGVGNSSSPNKKTDYTTPRMAQDALALMNMLGWNKAHVVGFSLGGMISIKLAALAPQRVKSLAVLSSTGGGHEVLPRSFRAIRYALKMMIAKTAEMRTEIDLKFHFKRSTLQKQVPHISGVSRSVRDLLKAEYLASSRASRPQPDCGLKGQVFAAWNHTVTDLDISAIKNSKAPVWFLHGRHDLAACAHFSEQLAARFAAPCILVDGAHFIPRENAVELALLLQSLFTLGHASLAATAAAGFHRTSLDGLALELGVIKPHGGSPSGAAAHAHASPQEALAATRSSDNKSNKGNGIITSHHTVNVSMLDSPGLKEPLKDSIV